jgi:hypothetical protein
MVQSGLPCRTIARLVLYFLVAYSGLFAMVPLCLCFSSALAFGSGCSLGGSLGV